MSRWVKRSMVGVIIFLMLACVVPGTNSAPQDQSVQQTVAALAYQSTQIAAGNQATLAAIASGQNAAQVPQPSQAVPTLLSPTAAPAATDVPPTAEPPTASAPTDVPATVAPTDAAPAVDTQATAQAKPMYDQLTTLVGNYELASANGVYYGQEPFDKIWYDHSEFGIFKLDMVNHIMHNYAIRASVAWRVQDQLQKPEQTGCGFVYGYQDKENLHVSYFAPDSIIHTLRYRGVEKIEMKGGHYPGGIGKMGGEVKLMITVEKQILRFFVNEMEVNTFKDPYLTDGSVGLATFTGSLSGTRCTFKDIGVWELK
jgi:hypothetical protein